MGGGAGIKKKLKQNDDLLNLPKTSGETKISGNKKLESIMKNSLFEFYIDYSGTYNRIERFKDMQKRKLNELAEAFSLIDFDRDGIINSDDLKKTFASLNQNDVTQKEIEQMMMEASKPLDFHSFVVMLGCKTLDLDPTEVLLDAFSFWDNERNGYIPHDRIIEDIVTLGDKFTEEEVKIGFIKFIKGSRLSGTLNI